MNRKSKKYHEVVDSAIMHPFSRPFRGRHTPRVGVMRLVANVVHNVRKKWGVEQELEWWMTKGNVVTESSSGDDEERSSDERIVVSESTAARSQE